MEEGKQRAFYWVADLKPRYAHDAVAFLIRRSDLKVMERVFHSRESDPELWSLQSGGEWISHASALEAAYEKAQQVTVREQATKEKVSVNRSWLENLDRELRHVKQQLTAVRHYLKETSMLKQQDIDTLATEFGTIDTTVLSINTTVAQFGPEIAALKEAAPEVDLSGLTTIATKLAQDSGTLKNSVESVAAVLGPKPDSTVAQEPTQSPVVAPPSESTII